MIPCRGRLWLLGWCRFGPAVSASIVAQCRLEGFVEEVPLVGAAPRLRRGMLAAASRPSIGPSCSFVVEFGPSPGGVLFPWATMASADFSPPIGCRCRFPAPVARKAEEISQGKTLLLPSSAAGFTAVVYGLAVGLSRPTPGYPTIAALYPVPVRRLRG